ncbi:uncharacterized protein [Apostichopus japonicus]|uniref:uncharacterized protein isoform X2 n=1 Tax=Stichopus japonicus TaxID=307972 RepID=UPI003AB3B043
MALCFPRYIITSIIALYMMFKVSASPVTRRDTTPGLCDAIDVLQKSAYDLYELMRESGRTECADGIEGFNEGWRQIEGISAVYNTTKMFEAALDIVRNRESTTAIEGLASDTHIHLIDVIRKLPKENLIEPISTFHYSDPSDASCTIVKRNFYMARQSRDFSRDIAYLLDTGGC